MLRWFAVFILTASIAWAAELQVEIRNSEVWLIRDGVAKQLTNDQKAKFQAILSPSQDRVAYYNQCPVDEHCTPSIVILDLEGKSVRSFAPRGTAQDGVCGSILYIWWTRPGKIAAECHINPSLSEYVETDLLTGETTRDLLGYWFTPSADGRKVAHVGWIPHFAPPFAHSNYLQIDNLTIYPLPQSARPVQQQGLAGPPYQPRRRDLKYFGIHDFETGPEWSPDMQHIAVIDCVYDWQADGAELTTGTESDRHCSIAVVSRTGHAKLFPLSDTAYSEAHLQWMDPQRLSLKVAGHPKKLFTLRYAQATTQ